MLTTFDLDEYVYEALRAGASGFLLKNSAPEELVEAIRVVAGGAALLDRAITRRAIERFAHSTVDERPGAQSLEELTPREREVLTLLASGLSNAEIADELVVGVGTVKTHVASILMKLDLRDRTQAVVLAYESGVVKPGQA
jgi:Response regulator containing a CheY-like receiver domain and an HTH DNA-binding domain